MDGTRIQALVNRGYALSARRVGTPHAHYRPVGAEDPVAHGGLLGHLDAAFSPDEHRFKRPQGYGRATWSALVDGAAVQVGDYLVGDSGTFFIAAKQPLLPILAVACNATVDVLRPHSPGGDGVLPYGGDVAADEDLIATGWPCSLLVEGRGEKPDAGLPGDARQPWHRVLLPAIPGGVEIRNADVLNDTLGRRYKVSSAELSPLGWRLSAVLAGA